MVVQLLSNWSIGVLFLTPLPKSFWTFYLNGWQLYLIVVYIWSPYRKVLMNTVHLFTVNLFSLLRCCVCACVHAVSLRHWQRTNLL